MDIKKLQNLDQEIVDSIPGIIVWKDLEGKYLKGSTEAAEFLGFKDACELIGITDYDLNCSASEFADEYRQFDETLIQEKTQKNVFSFARYRGDEWRLMFGQDGAFYDANSEIAGTSFHAKDVTDTPLFSLFCSVIEESIHLIQPKKLSKSMHILQQRYDEKFKVTVAESEVLFYTIRGKTAKEIARIKNISHRTVERHLANMKVKFNCKTNNELIQKCIALNLLGVIPESILFKRK